MPIESLREADALGYLRLQQEMILSDCNAILKTGENSFSALPVYIRKVNDGERFLVEIEAKFYEANKLPNFSRFEIKPEERKKQEAESAKTAEPQKPRNYAELLALNQEMQRRARAERYQQNQAVQGIESDDPALAEANRRHAAAVATSRGQRY